MAQDFDFPRPYFRFSVKLRPDVVFLDAVPIDDPQLSKSLASQAVGQLRTQGAGAANCQPLIDELGHLLGAAVDRFMMKFAGHLHPLQ